MHILRAQKQFLATTIVREYHTSETFVYIKYNLFWGCVVFVYLENGHFETKLNMIL